MTFFYFSGFDLRLGTAVLKRTISFRRYKLLSRLECEEHGGGEEWPLFYYTDTVLHGFTVNIKQIVDGKITPQCFAHIR